MKTDAALQHNVMEELKWWPGVDEAHIGVTAKDGVVALTGRVLHYAEKVSAENAAKGVYGVKGLANDIQVEVPGAFKRSDPEIAAAALNALTWDYVIPQDKITLVVRNGSITLNGALDWQYQKDAAYQCVRNLMGVTMVFNEITIKESVVPADVETKIDDAFRRNADLEARRINVSAAKGNVTLTGSVSTWSERDAAISAAWSAPGVMSVANEMTISP